MRIDFLLPIDIDCAYVFSKEGGTEGRKMRSFKRLVKSDESTNRNFVRAKVRSEWLSCLANLRHTVVDN